MASTYYDPRAQRAVAGAEAERARAEAEATRAETMLRLEAARAEQSARQAEQARRDRLDREHSRSARREDRRRQRAKSRATRSAAVRRGAGALGAALVTKAPVIVGGVAMGAPIAIAWRGQLEFARDVMHLDFMAPALPIALEGGVWYLAFLVHRAIKAKLPIGRYRIATWGMAAVAAGMNLWHGIDANKDDGLQVGVILALASLLGIALWELTASLTQQTTTKRSAAEIRRAAWRRVRYPRLSWAATSIRASRGEGCSIEQAWTAAWIDRYGVGPEASRRDRRLARSIVGYEKKADKAAAKDGRLVIRDGLIVRPGTPTPQQSEEGEEAMARLRAFTERRDDVARSIAFPSVGSPSIETVSCPAIESRTEPVRTPRTESVRQARTDAQESRTEPVRPSRTELAPVDREEAVAEIRQEIAAAAARGQMWTPDYPALEERYDRRRSWCEKAVREARTGIRTDGDDEARTDAEESHTDAPQSRTQPIRTEPEHDPRTDTQQSRTDEAGDSDEARTEVAA
ncbi:DUF2637 domain-containing protein [Streptosporangium canum]|uniref:DUF2637 domain-containing protein n=1 Tax=Streptosporangium canum TaxID=324952 RepID=UPI0034406EE8